MVVVLGRGIWYREFVIFPHGLQFLVDVAGSVERLLGGLVSCATGLVLSFGCQAIDLGGGGKRVKAKSTSVNDHLELHNTDYANLFINHLQNCAKFSEAR